MTLWRMSGQPAALGAAELIELPSLTRGEPWKDYGPWPELLARHGRAALAAAGYYLEHRTGPDLGSGFGPPVVGLDADGQPAACRAPLSPAVDTRTADDLLAEERAGMRVDRLWGELALVAAGHWESIETWANAPERTVLERRYWASATRWRRADPLIAAAAAAANLSEAEIDNLFRAAMALQAANT